MKVPARSAAAMRNSPARAVASRPSKVNVTVAPGSAGCEMAWCDVTTGSGRRSGIGTAAVFHVYQELVAEHADARGDRGRDRGPQHADRRLLGRPRHPRCQVVAHVHQEVDVGRAPHAVLDATQDLLEPATAFP